MFHETAYSLYVRDPEGAVVALSRHPTPAPAAALDPREPDRSMATLATCANRYPRAGWDRPKASDHCPLTVDLDIPEG